MSIEDRKRGALVGLAVGDALGAAVEFQPRGSFDRVTDYRGGGPHGLAPGEWTDDTSMALALADSIGTAGWDLNDQAAKYVAWWRHGKYSVNGTCFDIGITTRYSMSTFCHTGNAKSSGISSEQASGNGSIMRLAPVSIRYAHLFPKHLDVLAKYALESSLPTHGSPMCLSACAYLAIVLCGLIRGLSRDEVLSSEWEPLKWLCDTHGLHPLVEEVAKGSFYFKRQADIQGSGYVVKSLEAALWAFSGANNFKEAVLKAVNLGDDADTTGAVCGQLAGAYWGESRIPSNWREKLAQRDLIEQALIVLIKEDNHPDI